MAQNTRKLALLKLLEKRRGKGKAVAGTPAGFSAGLGGQKIRSGGLGRGLGIGRGFGPVGRMR